MSWHVNLGRLSQQCRLRLNCQVLSSYKTEVRQLSATTLFQITGGLDALQISAFNDGQHLAFVDGISLIHTKFNESAAVFSD